jgi:hypothetical protein
MVTALFTALPPTLMALAAFWQAIRNGRATAVVDAKTDVIHQLTNSNLTSVKADLAIALKRIETLEGHIVGMIEAKKAFDDAAQRKPN